jgi:hypothetical protein
MLLCITLVPRVWHESGLTACTGVGTLRAMKPLPRKCGWVAVTWGWLRLMHLCYAAVGFAIARIIFKREPIPVVDPVARFRASGLM